MMPRLYDAPVSGNCYKVRLLLSHLGRPYERITVDVVSRENRAEQIDNKSPIGRVPILELEDGRVLCESNAILWYLADGTDYLPADPYRRAQVLQWMFFEQNNHEPNIAVARYWVSILGKEEEFTARLVSRRQAGNAALAILEGQLSTREFLVGERYSIADIALYAYTHVAHEAGFEMERFPAIGRWLGRVREQPGHTPMLDPARPSES